MYWVKRVRVVKELGSVARIGGDLIALIHIDAGLTGYGPV